MEEDNILAKFPADAYCPCGTGRRHRYCCYSKDFDFIIDENLNVTRRIPLSEEALDLFDEQRQRFIDKFGREPNDKDPVFFQDDENSDDQVQPLEPKSIDGSLGYLIASVISQLNLPPAIAHAAHETGMVILGDNNNVVTEFDLLAWNKIIEDYESQLTHISEYDRIGALAMLDYSVGDVVDKNVKEEMIEILNRGQAYIFANTIRHEMNHEPLALIYQQEENRITIYDYDPKRFDNNALQVHYTTFSEVVRSYGTEVSFLFVDKYWNFSNHCYYASNLEVELTTPKKVFYSYSHDDEEYRDEMEKHLSMLKRQGLISEWHDRKIVPGKEWSEEINKHIEEADIIICLMSSSFLASDYCYEIEMKKALERHRNRECKVIPIFIRSCDWSGSPLAAIQGLPKDAKPISSWNNQDEAWTDVAKGLRVLLKDSE